MSEISRVLARLVYNNGAKIVCCKRSGIDPLIEWIKWLSYIPKEEQEKKQLLDKLTPQELSVEQLEELKKYKEQEELSKLFQKYARSECTKQEYLNVYDYTVKNSIMDLMIQKLNKQELIEAYRIVENCKLLPTEELYSIVEKYKLEENYEGLSPFDAFVLHVISDMCNSNLSNDIASEMATQKVLTKDVNEYKPLI